MKLSKLSKYYSWKRIKQMLFLSLSNLPMPGHLVRPYFVRMGGVKIEDPASCFIGKNIEWDAVAPDRIHIGRGCVITTGSMILTHFQNSQTGKWFLADVHIGNNVFIGAHTIITNPVTIGDGALIGAGSIVTKDIPAKEVWAGNPARFIRKRVISTK